MKTSKQSKRVQARPITGSRRRTILAFGRWVGFVVIGIAILLLLWNFVIQFEHRSSDGNQGVLLSAGYPRYLPNDDQGGIVITVVNTGEHPITDTVVSLVCGNMTEHVCMEFDGTSRMYFGSLEPNERKTKLVKFQVSRIHSIAQKMDIHLDLSAQYTTPITATLKIEPTIVSFFPLGVSSLVLNRTFTVPNLVVALAAVIGLVKLFPETVKAFREARDSDSEKQPSSRT
jgi:hypothetical protein